ncbi:hypothetical protein VPHD148_0080 [Vibrio phage D148]
MATSLVNTVFNKDRKTVGLVAAVTYTTLFAFGWFLGELSPII